MKKNKLIGLIIIPLSVAALGVLLLIIGGFGSTYWTYVGTIFFFALPAVPIIYGCITKEKIGSILIGVLPLFGIFISLFVVSHPDLADVRLPQIREFLSWVFA